MPQALAFFCAKGYVDAMKQHRPALAVLGICLALSAPAFAIQEVQIGPKAPSFAAASGGMGWEPLALPGQAPSYAMTPVSMPASWAFTTGETTRIGAMMFNTTSGPSWAVSQPAFGFGGLQPMSLGRMGDFGWTTRTTTGVMASDKLMFYTSVGSTTYNRPGALAPLPPGLALIEPPSQRMDVRAGFKVELAPGLTFGAEAAFTPATR